MAVLTVRLAGPLQSWGTGSRFTRRGTDDVPSKSGVLGMFAAALGLERTDRDGLARLLRFGFAVRVDQPGVMVRDFQTARSFDGTRSMPLSNRFYRADAVYVAGLEGERETLAELAEAVRRPVYPLFLGRRSCPPAGPVRADLHDGTLREVLAGTDERPRPELPWQGSEWYGEGRGPTVEVEYVHEVRGEGDIVHDVPESFSPEHRRYGWRQVRRDRLVLDNPYAPPDPAPAGPAVPTAPAAEPDFLAHL